ncbi:uncharacterized protein LOC117509839 [Thalassophryne amazonica]|uniref:uncharacterized protein LOC117509839 n=1 Tax=Thalassophryne amazonica TaxID=390379 RepID=UPI0014713843|nr:uncharacterized protein LOC117509839 [Thalassophryne amazonica]
MFAASQSSHNSETIADTASSQSQAQLPVARFSSFPPLSQAQNPMTNNQTTSSGSVAVSSTSDLSLKQQHQTVTKSHLSQFHNDQSSTQTSQAKVENSSQHMDQEPYSQHLPTLSKISKSDPQETSTQTPFSKVNFQQSTILFYLPSSQPTLSSSVESKQPKTHDQVSSMQTDPTVTWATLAQNQPRLYPTQPPQFNLQPPQQEPPPHQHREPLPDQMFELSTFDSEVHVDHQVTVSNQVQLNDSQQGHRVKSANNTELIDELKRNTSQSPMVSNDPRDMKEAPSWLPVLEKHDIPIVVGVGLSLAFIFITVTFYSVVQKNDSAPTSRSAQRNLGVPVRHTECRATGRTYENRAFEDDDCVAVIEQSPNTSDTRARPPGLSLVTVQVEPTSDDLQEDIQPTLDNCSVSVETYPEPILDTKVDSSMDEKGCSLSQPSIQLHAAEDWTISAGDNYSPCHVSLPPPSTLPSCSPSPSPPSRCVEGVHSSLTLQVAEPCGAPLHHNISISHANPPLQLSHHVSLGLTTVAVDIHFYPVATVSMALSTSTRITSVSSSASVAAPLFSPLLSNSQETDQSDGTLPHTK